MTQSGASPAAPSGSLIGVSTAFLGKVLCQVSCRYGRLHFSLPCSTCVACFAALARWTGGCFATFAHPFTGPITVSLSRFSWRYGTPLRVQIFHSSGGSNCDVCLYFDHSLSSCVLNLLLFVINSSSSAHLLTAVSHTILLLWCFWVSFHLVSFVGCVALPSADRSRHHAVLRHFIASTVWLAPPPL